MNSSEVGAATERHVAMALIDAGKDVFVPLFSAHSRVDLVVVDETGAYRVQCKTSRFVDGAVQFWTCSNTGGWRRPYRGDVDYFGVWSRELLEAFLVPVDLTPATLCRLRVEPTRNKQAKRVQFAADFRITAEQRPSSHSTTFSRLSRPASS